MNPLNVVRTTFQALQKQITAEELAAMRQKSLLFEEGADSVPRIIARHPTNKRKTVRLFQS